MRGACGGARAARASARAGMGFRVVVGTALAVLLLCGVSLAAPGGGGPSGEMPARDAGAGSDHDAAGLEEELRVGAAELAAVPAESRALFARVLGRLEGMRGELEELKADKVRSDARIAKLEESLEAESSAYRHRKQDASDASGTTAMPPTCYGTDDIAMVALNASVALSQSHEQLRELLLSDASTRQELVERLGAKANTSAVDAQLRRKAGVEEMVALSTRLEDTINMNIRLLAAKANASTVAALSNALANATAALADKAEESSVIARLASKAGIEAVQAALANKVDETRAAIWLGDKANATEVTALSATLAEVVSVLSEKAAESSVVTRLAEKADAFALGVLTATVSEKADSDAVTNASDLVQSLASDLAATRTEVSGLHARRAEYTCPGGNLTNLTACLPPCDADNHGFELLATIDGTDTKFSCNLAHGLYSWMGAASEGGYLGADAQSFFSAVISGAAGSYIVTLTEDVGISTDVMIRPGQDVRISGDLGLAVAPSWGSGGFTVGEQGSLTVTYVSFDASASLTVTSGGSLSLASMDLPAAVLNGAEGQLSGAGSTLRLAAVTLPNAGELTGTTTVRADGSRTTDPLGFGGPFFTVSSGPCIAYGGCVGRPEGYGPSEDCAIVVGGGGGVLGPCSVFDFEAVDYLTLQGSHWPPRTDYPHGSDCPAGMVLAPGDSVGWHSTNSAQGTVAPCAGCPSGGVNGCAEKGTCARPFSYLGLGGGWQICFS
eukprot:COSAG06_NODE_772_length_12432_cov_119.880159_13_plen_730_part_00